jgi:hypothetical protein
LQLARLRECDDPQTTVVYCQYHTDQRDHSGYGHLPGVRPG